MARQTEEGSTASRQRVALFGSAAARAMNRLNDWCADSAGKNRGLTKPILWIAIPTAAEMIGAFDESAIISCVRPYDALQWIMRPIRR